MLKEIINRGCDHHGKAEQETEFRCRRASHSAGHTSDDRCPRPRDARNKRKYLREPYDKSIFHRHCFDLGFLTMYTDKTFNIHDNDSAYDKTDRNGQRRKKVFCDRRMQEKTDNCNRQECNEQMGPESAGTGSEIRGIQCFPQIASIDKADGKDRSELNDDLEKLGPIGRSDRFLKFQKVIGNDQMSGRRNRNEFG